MVVSRVRSLSPQCSPLVFSSVLDIRRIQRPWTTSHTLEPKAQSPEVGVQWSSVFVSIPNPFVAPSPLSFSSSECCLSSLFTFSISADPSFSLGPPFPSFSPLPLPHRTALLSRAAPSRVHPIPDFNWDINKVCLALPFDPGNWDWGFTDTTRSA